MRRIGLAFLFFILVFPAMEIYTLFLAADVMGWWLLAWLILSGLTGWILIKEESMAIIGRLAVAVQNGQSPIAAVWDSGRTMLAALLLIFPGVLSDFAALVLLLLPNRAEQPGTRTMPDDDIIEGEVRVIEAEQIESKSKNH